MNVIKDKKNPVLLIVFNRPELTKSVLKCLEVYKPNDLFVVADGPRKGNTLDIELCEETRKLFDNIGWDCNVVRNFRKENLGCKRSVSDGISWFFGLVEQGIILEDDIIVSESFFRYCDELLERYKNEDQISMIAGTDFSFGKWLPSNSYGFSYYSNIWGWASWRRAWKDYDVEMKQFSFEDDKFLTELGFERSEIDYWKRVFLRVQENGIDTWDFQWVFANFNLKRVSINPKGNLVSNLGFMHGATHTKSRNSKLANMQRVDLPFPLSHPSRITVDQNLMKYSREIFLGNFFKNKIRYFVFSILNRIGFKK